jgi:fructokinase
MAMQPSSSVIEKWARDHFDQGSVTISHDINMRPALGFNAAEERVRVERLNQISHIIKASDEDIQWLYGLDEGADVDNIVADWIGDTERIVLVTRGADGTSIYRRRSTRTDVPSRKINVVDTVGAGDTFCANLLGQLSDADALGSNPFDRLENLSDAELRDFVRVASVAASITCERAGCEPPTQADLAETLRSL